MYGQQRNRTQTKNSFIPKRLVSLPALLKKRTKNRRVQTIKAELAARTLYVVDGDVIIITSLDRKPFCCQEELSIMARPELCGVARELNKKLPYALRIEPGKSMSSAVLRMRIEEMMGFRHFRSNAKVQNRHSCQPAYIGALVMHQMRTGRRSPTSSFSSGSSRSSAPYGLSVVTEMEEEFGDIPWSVSKHNLPPMSNGCHVPQH